MWRQEFGAAAEDIFCKIFRLFIIIIAPEKIANTYLIAMAEFLKEIVLLRWLKLVK